MENPVIIFGCNPLGRQAKEIFEGNNNVVYGFLDDDRKLHNTEVDEVMVLGSTDDDGFLKLIGKKCEAFVALDDNKVRKNLVKLLHEARHVQPVNAVHPRALVSPRAEIGHGNFIDADVVVAPGARIRNHCIMQAKCCLGVDVNLGDFVQIGAGTVLNAGVSVEEEAFVGAGVTIVSGVTVGKGARVGAGSVVIASVKAGETVFGNPAQPVK